MQTTGQLNLFVICATPRHQMASNNGCVNIVDSSPCKKQHDYTCSALGYGNQMDKTSFQTNDFQSLYATILSATIGCSVLNREKLLHEFNLCLSPDSASACTSNLCFAAGTCTWLVPLVVCCVCHLHLNHCYH